ncbi:MAG: DNA ligase D [Christiangramia sp.]|uniref:DNA ligase D n=1 Tax=Christiangramia sp. TaxID=1931228 RepID=UPI0032422FD5
MSLDEYQKKRNFSKTPEPKAEVDASNKGRFVVQRHEATRLHYDLRLEIDGVLKSWAVPKGPSMSHRDKRLAVETEDHPVKYLYFEGNIPKGNYGAGDMWIWDEGLFYSGTKDSDLSEAYKNGDLKLVFNGKKLKGEFALVRTNRKETQNHWLLIKKKDDFSTDLNYDAEDYFSGKAKPETRSTLKLRDPVQPMLATPAKEIFNDPGWIYELKWDGYRLITHVSDGQVYIHSRNGISYNSKFPNLVQDLEQIPQDVILDGEVVVLDEEGKPLFQELQNYSSKTQGALRYYVFDMLFLNGHSMLDLPLTQRKSLIPEVLEDTELAIYCDHIESLGTAFYNKAIEAGLEGVIAKKADSLYDPGRRSENWLKIKAVESLEAVICGYTDSKASPFGSLILGVFESDELRYIGNCGTGFSVSQQQEILNKLKPFQQETSPFSRKIKLKGRKPNWTAPEVICEVNFSEWTRDEHLRHPVFKAIREDKLPAEITIPKQQQAENIQNKETTSDNTLEIDDRKLKLTNLDKVYWPNSGLRKYDLIDYYLQVADYILPYLKDRPENMHRHPNGIGRPGFYQKDNEGLLEDWVETTRIHSKSAARDIEYLLCQDEATLLYMANLGCIEINPWNSTIHNLDRPDYAVIDLDPSDKNTFEEVIEVALVAHEILENIEVPAYCKTSGSSGLHIYLPLGGKYSYDEARDFTKLVCYFIQEQTKKLTSMERVIKNRKGKIYLDYLQNRRGQTLASAYCVRPKKSAPVSAPLEWKEVKKGLKIQDFNLKNMPERLQQKGDLFSPVLSEGLNMEKAIKALEGL